MLDINRYPFCCPLANRTSINVKQFEMRNTIYPTAQATAYLILVLLCSSLLGCNRSFRPTVKTGFEGEPLPEFKLLLPDSNTVINTADIPKGSPIVLVYFSPNCPYSQAEMTNIINDISNLKGVRFCILTSWPFSQLKGFYAYYQLHKYQNIVVGEDFNNYFSGHFKPIGVPFTMIYNREKKLSNAFVGTMPGLQLENITANN